jgi:hypothetical protein
MRLDQRLVTDMFSAPCLESNPGRPYVAIQVNVEPNKTPKYSFYAKKNIRYITPNFRMFKGEEIGRAWKDAI